MQRVGKLLPKETQGVLIRPSSESDKILNALDQMATRLHRPLTDKWINQFLADVNSYQVGAVEYALDSWGRNGKGLPTPANLTPLLESWSSQNVEVQFCGNCDTGWVAGYTDRAGNAAVKRCECVSK